MNRRKLPTFERLHSVLIYNGETGKLFWKERGIEDFRDGYHTATTSMNSWNAKHAGQEAFTAKTAHGYRVGAIDKKLFLAHRIIWKMAYGTEPEILDHINGDPEYNRLDNLRVATSQENARNMRLNTRNSTGVSGVGWHKQAGKWRAYITVGRRQLPLGLFETMEEAIAARKTAEASFGFHKNHGRITPEDVEKAA
ncbi:HNH endonuclease protein [Rhizobium phage RHph_N3_2]|nr:HNH endonuclease protein [Rhizobium phage RHph_N3_2]